MILADLQNKIAFYEKSTNFYSKTVSERSDKVVSYEKFIKDDVRKEVITAKNPTATITQITTPTEVRVYTESADRKVLNIHPEDQSLVSYSGIVNYVDYGSLAGTIVNSLGLSITNEKINEKEYYVLRGHTNNFIYTKDTIDVKVYIDKATGLTEKVVETAKENGEKKEYVIYYEYKFDVVTQEDMQEPDRTEFEIQE